MKLSITLIILILSNLAHGGLINVSNIKITSTHNTYIQVTEVLAISSISGLDLALSTAGASTNAFYTPDATVYQPEHAIDGVTSGQNYYHSHNSTSDYLSIILDSPSELESLTIYGRTISCCYSRDIFDIEFFDANGNSVYVANAVNANTTDHSASISLPNTAIAEPISEPNIWAVWALGIIGLFGIGMNRAKWRMENGEWRMEKILP